MDLKSKVSATFHYSETMHPEKEISDGTCFFP